MSKWLFLGLLFLCSAETANKIVFLISPPRSLSTGFLRMMQARGDFEIFHEPSLSPLAIEKYQKFHKEHVREDAFQTWGEVVDSVLEARRDAHVFVKEMSFLSCEFLLSDERLVNDPDVYFVFLLRKPQDVIISFYEKQYDGSLEYFNQFIGYRQTYELYEQVKERGMNAPYVILSEELGNHPSEVVSAFCQFVGIPFLPHSLEWEDLGADFTGLMEWRESKKHREDVHHWHGKAIRSTGFMPLRTAEVDAEKVPTFSEVKNPADREVCQKVYWYQLPYYLKIAVS